MIEALYFKNVQAAESEVEHIQQKPYRLYYKALILLEKGDIYEANDVIEDITTPWMKLALLAKRERKLDKSVPGKKLC